MANRITRALLDAQVELLNNYTNRTEGNLYYVGSENGQVHLFLEVDGGRQTVSYGNTKSELSKQLSTLISVFAIETNKR